MLKKLINLNLDINISIFYEKQEKNKKIRELTYNIVNLGTEIKRKNKNKINQDLIISTYEDAKYIKKEMQINNEELYYLYIYLIITVENKEEIKKITNKIHGICEEIGINIKLALCRQEQIFFSCLPILENSIDVKNICKKNVLTSGLVATYPFISENINDENGILYGKNINNHSMIFIDKFNLKKYKNANSFILGVSGAGKSYFTKLMIFRNRIFGINQFVIDPEREYSKICNGLDGVILKIGPNSNVYINILEIRQESLEDEQKGYLANKITKIFGFLNLIFGKITEIEKAVLEEKLIECYNKKEINFDDNSLFKMNENRLEFKKSKEMPILQDLYNILKEDKQTKNFAVKLFPFVKGSLKFFNNYTNIDLNNKLIIADIYELEEEILKIGMYIVADLFWDKIKRNREERKIIYFDEIWRLIGSTSNKHVASFIYKIFKTIRKYGGSAHGISQDVLDLFSLEEGIYGKSLLSNSEIKIIFSLEQENITLLKRYIDISDEEMEKIKKLRQGECVLQTVESKTYMKVESTEVESEII